jgi:hypothetical protein
LTPECPIQADTKEVHETLYHFHKPKDEAEANLWMRRALVTYNNGHHRAEPHSRVEDWLKNLPPSGVRAMCSWERFCAFARVSIGLETGLIRNLGAGSRSVSGVSR